MVNAKEVKIWCFIGPSGTGKTYLTKKAIKYLNNKKENTVGEIVSHTTRPMRVGEEEGKHYYFVDEKTFNELEKVEETTYAGNHYCISKQEIDRVLSKYKKIFVVVEINGYRQLKEAFGDEVGAVFIETPIELLEKRLILRGDKPEDIKKRMDNLKNSNEMDNKKYCDFSFYNTWPEENIKVNNEMLFCQMCENDLKIS